MTEYATRLTTSPAKQTKKIKRKKEKRKQIKEQPSLGIRKRASSSASPTNIT